MIDSIDYVIVGVLESRRHGAEACQCGSHSHLLPPLPLSRTAPSCKDATEEKARQGTEQSTSSPPDERECSALLARRAIRRVARGSIGSWGWLVCSSLLHLISCCQHHRPGDGVWLLRPYLRERLVRVAVTSAL
jgi:hypothetical protein